MKTSRPNRTRFSGDAPNPTNAELASPKDVLPFGKRNYMYLLIGIGILITGFFLLSIEKEFIDAFKIDAQGKAVRQFSIALYLAPVVITMGYIAIIYAIISKKKDLEPATEQPSE
jgi:hypothetical protein